MSDLVTVICLSPRALVSRSLRTGSEWRITAAKAKRLVALGQVKPATEADAKLIEAAVEPVVPVEEVPASPTPQPSPAAPESNDFDEAGSVNERDPEPETAAPKKTALQRAKEKAHA